MKGMALNNPYIKAFWYSSNNFGDNLNHYLIKKLSGKPVVLSDRLTPHYIVCGSILTEANKYSTVWGAGFSWDHYQPFDKDAQYITVRGNLSAERINKNVQFVGDPAIVLSLLYQPPAHKKYQYGIIPHWSEHEFFLNNYSNLHIIDPFQSVEDFIDDVASCEKVLSSGLHGLIVADTYGIPNAWIDLSKKDHFKYQDYYSTTKSIRNSPVDNIDFGDCEVHQYRYSLNDFLNSCPFINGWN